MPLELHSAVVSRIKIMAGMDVAERRRPQDGRISIMIRKSPLDVRVSTLPTVLGEKVVMRLLDDEALRPSPDQLGIRDQNLRIILDKITAPHGLIMISGPTGSGKTTTLYSCLSAADRAHRNVVTIEDPVEYRLRGVHQMQVSEKIGLSFASGLRTILRQDPDVIMVGECRDAETAHMAVQAALTGHVVFSTIHANDCISVLTRLLDMRVDSFLVASALSLSISQRLVRVSCKHCAVMVEGREILRLLRAEGVSAEKMARLGLSIDDKMPCVHPAGCPHCRHTGYAGRQAVFEMLEINAEIRKLIVSENFEVDALRLLARKSGMVPMIGHGLQLVEEGRTTYSELIRVFGDG
jgi:type II secretory ATPase GspE/PulE/Tfp pilus assembly ATPase PilB-like protein